MPSKKVFISYSRDDRDLVEKLKDRTKDGTRDE